ncbi:hypothetical protein BT93_C0835 [Corymbia citriodora subsp. variegata]|nr:hypothetical protein BT93_C0835 [Corymbia citriodora subsp. variegata]
MVLHITYSLFITKTITSFSVLHRQLHIEIPLLSQNLNLIHYTRALFFKLYGFKRPRFAIDLNFCILLFLTCIFIKPLSKHGY